MDELGLTFEKSLNTTVSMQIPSYPSYPHENVSSFFLFLMPKDSHGIFCAFLPPRFVQLPLVFYYWGFLQCPMSIVGQCPMLLSCESIKFCLWAYERRRPPKCPIVLPSRRSAIFFTLFSYILSYLFCSAPT